MDQEVFDKLGIRTIFPPAKDNWETLYVQFESEIAVNTIFSYAKNLKKNQRLVRYIPKEFYERYRAMEGMPIYLGKVTRNTRQRFKWVFMT